ncbi:hypothetical protein ANCCAN_17840 [Ancylostoma caninum]|uniref:Uncharacterized protein n=1 Tax=Ancylostoma caninum TaxID=29170 RepID=A0A368G126_ANCCA|nr:hypothetical protein ANCCAN_17840 [Ancylostoma caninum]
MGCFIVLSNLMFLVVLNCGAAMRRRYVFFTLVAVGDILDGMYLIYPSIMRIAEMANGTFWGGKRGMREVQAIKQIQSVSD